MDFLNLKLFPTNLVEPIGNTLIHSLWQGVLLAAITAVIIVSTRKSSPVMRYNLLISALLLFVIGVAITFFKVFSSAVINKAPSSHNGAFIFQTNTINIQLPHEHLVDTKLAYTDMIMNFINKNANGIVLIWFVIVCARSLQLASGLNGLYYLRRKSIFAIDEQLEIRVKELKLKLGISRIVNLAQSGIAKVPMVIGHLKPLILIPFGLIATLTTEEVEAILVHELAHIRRRDYLVNMLQSFMEIIFFFNPAVLWISALIKTERENCCDDIVIAQSSSKADYIKALVSCQEYNMQAPIYAMALTGNKNQLLSRVKRMLSHNNQSLNIMEKSLLAVCLVSAGLLTAAFSNADKINMLVTKTARAVVHLTDNLNKKEVAHKIEAKKRFAQPATNILFAGKNSVVPKSDTAKETKFKVYHSAEVSEHAFVSVQNGLFTSQLYKQDGILYQLNYKDNVLTSMQVNGKTIPDDHITSYQSIIEQIQRKNNMAYAKQPDAIYITNMSGSISGTPEKTVTATQIQQEMEALIRENEDLMRKRTIEFDQFVAYGDAYRTTGHYQDALDFYKKAESINPLNPTLEKKITDTKIQLDDHKTPEEKLKDVEAAAKERNAAQVNSFTAYGDYYVTKQRYRDAIDSYKKAEVISPFNTDLEQKIASTQKQLNQYVADSVNHAYGNGSHSTSPKQALPAKTSRKAATTPYPTNYAYTAAGKGAIARKDSVEREHIIDDMKKDGLIQTTDNLSFKIGTKEFIVNGKKQPDDIYQKYRAKYVKVVGHREWSWYYNFDTNQKRTVNSITDEPKK